MAELKTQRTSMSPTAFLKRIADEKKRKDAMALLALMKKVTGKKPEMWGSSIVGFGRYCYRYESGRELEWFLTGFSPRAQNLTVYLISGARRHGDLLKKLGKHKTGGGCLYFKTLDDLDLGTLRQLISRSVKETAQRDAREPR